MKYIKLFEDFDRLEKILSGGVPNWENLTPDERVEYIHADKSRLEIEYQKIFSEGATGGYGNNERLWVFFGMLLVWLNELGYSQLVLEMKWRISEHESPIKLSKEIINKIDLSKLNDYQRGRLLQINDMSDSINPYVDDIIGF